MEREELRNPSFIEPIREEGRCHAALPEIVRPSAWPYCKPSTHTVAMPLKLGTVL